MKVDEKKECRGWRGWRSPFQDVRWFLGFYYVTCVAVWAALAHNNAVTRTLERRFGLSAFQSGFILSVNDIVNTVLVLFIGYFGRTFSKPHFLGIMCFVGAFGCALFALPYPLYPRGSIDNSTKTPDLCLPFPVPEQKCENDAGVSNSDQAYAVLLAASAILGIGNSGLGVLSITYIDENTPRNVGALYIAIASTANTVGPLFGFALSYVTLRQPENLKESEYELDDDLYVGCWWLAFLVWAGVMVLGSIGMLLCPKHLPYYYEQKQKALDELTQSKVTDSISKQNSKTAKEVAKETWLNLKSVLTNVPYILLVVSTLTAYYVVPGIFGQIAKYLVVQFKVDQSATAVYTGLSTALVLTISLIFVGWFIKKTNLKLRGAIILFTVAIIGTTLSMVGMMFWDCDQREVAGINSDITYFPECRDQSGCECSRVQPMCSSVDDVTFISPCHAGCSRVRRTEDGAVFFNCKCVYGETGNETTFGQGEVKGGICSMPVCNTFRAFLLFVAGMSCFSAGTRLGAVIITLRLVRKDMKPFAMGFTSCIHNLLAFVPGPIMFGAIFDSTCLLWQELKCGERGACIVYNMDDYRYYMHGVSIAFHVIALVLVPPMYHTAKPLFNVTSAADESIFGIGENKSTEVRNEILSKQDKYKISQNMNGIVNQGAKFNDEDLFVTGGYLNLHDEKTSL